MPVAPDAVAEEVIQICVKLPSGGNFRVKALQRAAGGIARIGEQRFFGGLALGIDAFKLLPRQQYLAANFKLVGPVARLKYQRNGADCTHVHRNVVALHAVAARHSAHQPSVYIGQRD